jgi:hypothetical protein
VKDHLPEEGLYMLPYHSFYAAHREGAYYYFMKDHDRRMFEWVNRFNPSDPYTKSPVQYDPVALRPYYEDLIAKYPRRTQALADGMFLDMAKICLAHLNIRTAGCLG